MVQHPRYHVSHTKACEQHSPEAEALYSLGFAQTSTPNANTAARVSILGAFGSSSLLTSAGQKLKLNEVTSPRQRFK